MRAERLWGGVLLLALCACEADETKPAPIPPELRQRGAARLPPKGPAPKTATRITVTVATGKATLGLDGTVERATLWSSRPAADEDGDPEARAVTLEGEVLNALWSSIDALPWRGGRFDRGWGPGSELLVQRGGEQGSLTHYERAPGARLLDGGVTDAVAVAQRALEAALEKADAGTLGGTTALVVPQRPAAIEAKWVTEAYCDSRGQLICRTNTDAMCFPTGSPAVFNCFTEPWAESGQLLTNHKERGNRPTMPVYFQSAWAMELEGNRCKSPIRDGSRFDCAGGGQLTAVLAGKTRWVAHRVAGEGPDKQPLLGAPVVLTRVFPRSGQLALGTKVGEVDAFELSVQSGNGLSQHQEQIVLAGDRRGAKGWVLSSRERGAASVTVRRGSLSEAQVDALWKRLGALKWPALRDTRGGATDLTGSTLTLSAGGVVHAVTSEGSCSCVACECPTEEAVAAVRTLAGAWPEVKWSTRAVTIKPMAGGKKVSGRCADGRCSVDETEERRRCLEVAKSGLMWCPAKPWETTGVYVQPSTGRRSGANQDALWGLELDDGERCEETHWRGFECTGGTRITELVKGEGGRMAGVAEREGRLVPALVKTVWGPAPASANARQ